MSELSQHLLEEISTVVALRMGVYFPKEKWINLENAFKRAAKDLGYKNVTEFSRWFLDTSFDQKTLEFMVGFLTIGETYFFRENLSFDLVEHKVIPQLIRTCLHGKKRIRIWSAGCSTGEEPYSLAILLYRMRDIFKDWEITIIATDINHKSLKKAKRGVYSEWSFRSTPEWVKDHYFTRTRSGQYEIIPPIKKMVEFSYLNLVEDHYPSLKNNTDTMNIIFCRNVLMYFKPETAKGIVERFKTSMVTDGWLFVSACESSNYIFKNLTLESSPNIILYRNYINKNMSSHVSRKRVEAFNSIAKPKKMLNPTLHKKARDKKLKNTTLMEEARFLHDKGMYDNALILLETYLVSQPKSTDAIELIGKILANRGDLEAASKYVGKGLTIDKLHLGLNYLQALVFIEMNKLEAAITSLKHTVFIAPEFILAYFTLGNLMTQRKDFSTAKRYFKIALSLLTKIDDKDVVPETDGLSVKRLKEIIGSTIDITLL